MLGFEGERGERPVGAASALGVGQKRPRVELAGRLIRPHLDPSPGRRVIDSSVASKPGAVDHEAVVVTGGKREPDAAAEHRTRLQVEGPLGIDGLAVGNQVLADGDKGGGVDRDDMVVDRALARPAEVPVGVVAERAHGRRIGRGAHVDMKGRVDESIMHGCGERAGEAHVTVGTHE